MYLGQRVNACGTHDNNESAKGSDVFPSYSLPVACDKTAKALGREHKRDDEGLATLGEVTDSKCGSIVGFEQPHSE